MRMCMKNLSLSLLLAMLICTDAYAASDEQRGIYFHRAAYTPSVLPRFEEVRGDLPSPIWDENPEWVELYWKAWEIAFSNLQSPPEGSPLVANWIDEGLSPQIFQWDTHFMAMFGRYAHHLFPFIESHDNFYARQHEDGMICRVINEADGADHHWGLGDNYARTINPPLFSWAEMEYFRFSDDTARLARVLLPIEKYIEWVEQHRKAVGTEHGLYWSNGQASGMDNTPRDMGRPSANGDIHSSTSPMGWVDMSSQIKMCYDNLAEICRILGHKRKAKAYTKKANELGTRINHYMWSDSTGLYHDVDPNSVRTPWITTAAFWPILADIASPEQVERMTEAIQDPNLFWRLLPLPSLAANQPYYDRCGCYWRGGVWAPTTYMTVKGLERHGHAELAEVIARKNMQTMCKVYQSTGTIWELYSPDMYMPATNETGIYMVKPDFVGWSGLIPISMFVENIIGISVDGSTNRIVWRTDNISRHGIRNLRFGNITTTLICEGNTIIAESTAPYTLVVNGVEYRINEGTNHINLSDDRTRRVY